jgi:class 3 adenylate cyclase
LDKLDHGKKGNIIISEDESIIAIDLKRTLNKLGYNVTSVVNSGEELIKRIPSEKPDLVLMDILLSGKMNGIDTAKIIKEDFNIPVVYLTALTDEEILKKAMITEPYGYLLKPFEQRSLNSTLEMAMYKHNIETKVRQKTRELEEEKVKTDQLLHNILPAQIVSEWKEKGKINPRNYKSASILFTDFYNFASHASALTPEEILKELNEIFSEFDDIIVEFQLEKLKTIGDSYLVSGGIPDEFQDHAVRVINAAIKMRNYINERNKKSSHKWKFRAGVNSGEVIAGVVGNNKFTYDVWGDTVNIASRMSSCCDPDEINISGPTFNLVKDYFDCEYRGKLNAKGKGEIDMYFIKGIKKNAKISISDLDNITA